MELHQLILLFMAMALGYFLGKLYVRGNTSARVLSVAQTAQRKVSEWHQKFLQSKAEVAELTCKLDECTVKVAELQKELEQCKHEATSCVEPYKATIAKLQKELEQCKHEATSCVEPYKAAIAKLQEKRQEHYRAFRVLENNHSQLVTDREFSLKEATKAAESLFMNYPPQWFLGELLSALVAGRDAAAANFKELPSVSPDALHIVKCEPAAGSQDTTSLSSVDIFNVAGPTEARIDSESK